MIKEITASGKTVAEAKENARLALGAQELDDVTFEIIDLGSRGFLGFMAKPARVKASMEVPDAPKHERRAAVREEEQRAERPVRAERPERPERPEKKQKADRPQSERKPKAERQNAERRPAPVKDTTPRAAVVPETELTFTPVEAAEGDDPSLDFIRRLLSDLALSDVSADLYSCDDGTRRIAITGENASMLIGHHGDTLDALQYLANLASAQKNAKGERIRSRVTIDIGGYRAKREEALRRLARRMAEKALRKGSKVTLEPMTPYERRIIHSEVQKIDGVFTQSVGSDASRKIVIYVERPAKKQPSSQEEIPAPESETITVTEVSDEVIEGPETVDAVTGETAVSITFEESVEEAENTPHETAEDDVVADEVTESTESDDKTNA